MPASGDQSLLGTGTRSSVAPANILLGRYELGRLLGCGASAKVYLARNLRSGQSVAIKCFRKVSIANGGLANHIKREICILRRLRHPRIVRLHEVLASRSKIYFVLELVKGGELFACVASRGRLPENLCRRYFHQLIAAVGYCHSRGIFHRDLKLENLLLDENGEIKVSDFGLSAVPEQIRGDGLFHTLCGTPAYVAPEILAKKGYRAAAVDLWSCGVILFVLVAGYLPFNDPNLMAMYRKIYRGEYRCPKWVSPELKFLISRLLDTNPESRITVDEILLDPWFRKGLDEEKCASLARFCEEPMAVEENKTSMAEAINAEDRPLNAFDIIGFSSGVDLSGLFGAPAERERFISDVSPEGIFRRVEESGRNDGFVVRRKGEKGCAGVTVHGQNGNLVVAVEVYRLAGGLNVVEVQRGRAAVGGGRWAGEFWNLEGEGSP
ncbi:CBL-interacting serine/threonine-protein kinase 11 [Apostasia shenzhenica]|uniref:non-specific serine/threonine protein kinase n=1 Tax=Apostasia shenzhenica TaxID=1088818 RepID=A0A2I0BGD6_9ASPA|nr:CBL-interacting serine/threonine-protein kinase 11 [Apostasia shenzhenica]